MTHVVVFLDNESYSPSEAQLSILNKLSHYGGPPLYFVSFGGQTNELSNLLGFNDTEKKLGIVFTLSTHSGYASEELWNWLEGQSA